MLYCLVWPSQCSNLLSTTLEVIMRHSNPYTTRPSQCSNLLSTTLEVIMRHANHYTTRPSQCSNLLSTTLEVIMRHSNPYTTRPSQCSNLLSTTLEVIMRHANLMRLTITPPMGFYVFEKSHKISFNFSTQSLYTHVQLDFDSDLIFNYVAHTR